MRSLERLSTSGLAPVFSATIRFWINVESLKRPPTLLTISSSFKSSNTSSLPQLLGQNVLGSPHTILRPRGRVHHLEYVGQTRAPDPIRSPLLPVAVESTLLN